jgi:cyclase
LITKRIIPSLLLKKGRLVKGVRFEELRDAGNPGTTALAHNSQKADEILLLDITASKERRPPDYNSIAKVAAECYMPLTVGGGISSLEIAHQCMEIGADKLCLCTTAYEHPDLLSDLAEVYGSQAVMLRADVVKENGRHLLYDHRRREPWTGKGLMEWIQEGVSAGAGEISIMAVDREGTRSGFDRELLQQVMDAVDVPVILEGGAGTLEHLSEALDWGADALALGTMLVFSDNNIVKIKSYLAMKGHSIRL